MCPRLRDGCRRVTALIYEQEVDIVISNEVWRVPKDQSALTCDGSNDALERCRSFELRQVFQFASQRASRKFILATLTWRCPRLRCGLEDLSAEESDIVSVPL
jgi:hypothetical protein